MILNGPYFGLVKMDLIFEFNLIYILNHQYIIIVLNRIFIIIIIYFSNFWP